MLGKIKTQTSIGGGGGSLSQQLRNWLMQIGQRFWWYIALTESSTQPLNRQVTTHVAVYGLKRSLITLLAPAKLPHPKKLFIFSIKFLFSVRQPVIGAAETEREAPP